MRASKILKIFLVLILLLSVVLSVTIFVSSSFKLVFKDNLEARQKIVSNTTLNLKENLEKYGISLTHKYKESDSTRVEETISCINEKDGVKCSQIQYIYSIEKDGSSKLSRTVFTPDETNSYITDGTSKVKTSYTGGSLELKANTLLLSYISLLPGLEDSSDKENNIFVQYDVALQFIFNTFSLNKKIDYTRLDNGFKTKINYVVDKKDRVMTIESEGEVISFIYGKYELSLPSIDGYVAE